MNVEVKPKKATAAMIFAAAALVIVTVFTVVSQFKIHSSMTSIRESGSSIDASLVTASLLLARSETGSYPTSIGTNKYRELLFDGELVLDSDGEIITLLEGKTIKDYTIKDGVYTFCVVDEHGPWALVDSVSEDLIISGREDQACTA